MAVVRNCTASVNRLQCGILNNSMISLVIQDQVVLANVEIRIRTCESSLWPIFTFSNQTVVDNAADYLQCPTNIPLGQLTVTFDLNVFMNKTNGPGPDFIVIDTLVSV